MSRTQKDKYCVIHVHEDPEAVKLRETESRNGRDQGSGGRGVRSYCLVGTEFQFYKMGRVLEIGFPTV